MKTRTSILLLFAATIMIITGCNKSGIRVKGNGNMTTETRSLSAFSIMINEGAFDVYIIQDSVSEVTIEAESNLISHIDTDVSGTTLTIDTRDNLKNTKPMKLYIRTPDVNGVTLSGSGIIDLGSISTDNIEVSLSGSGDISGIVNAGFISVSINGSGSADMGVQCNQIETSISGSGDMYFDGLATTAHYNISGSGAVKAYNLELSNCYTNISGSGNMYVHATEILDVKISGSGSVYYIGTPQINIDITGSGSVINAN